MKLPPIRIVVTESKLDNVHPILRGSTLFHRKPDFAMWALWFFATAGPGALWALVFYLRTRSNSDAFFYTIYYELLVGAVIGVFQGLVLRRYLSIKWWWMWSLLTWTGWVCALLFLMFGFIFSMGTMMDPVDFEDTSTLQCVWLFACGIAGWTVGATQSFYFPRYLSSVRSVWFVMNAIGWIIGGFIGRIAGTIAFKIATGGRYIYGNSPEQSLSAAIGILVAAIIIGAIMGAVIVWSLNSDTRERLLAQTQEGSNTTS